MGYKINLLAGVLLFISLGAFATSEAKNLPRCNFPAIFNFGDSNSDTGDYFSDANDPKTIKIKRLASDGRLIMDFITEKMGRPYLPSAYFGKFNYQTGANFAAGGATIRNLETSKFIYLGNETAAFTQFKARVIRIQSQGKRNKTLPRPHDFKKSLYTIDIGQNDLAPLLYGPYHQEIPDLIRQFAVRVKNLYDKGARVFWIHSTGPLGCLPGIEYARPPSITRDLDEFGCLKHDNQVASEFNKQLKDKVVELRAEFKDAKITYVDVYTAKYKLFSNAKNLGFALSCSGTCKDPSKYILWDNIHYTEAANRLVAENIFYGALSDPPLPITHACYQFITT